MSLTAEFNGYYTPPSATSGQSAQLQDFAIYNPAGMSSQQEDFAIYNPVGMSAQLEDQGGSPVVIQGINLATGRFQLVAAGDIVTKSDASIYNSTGINGITGLQGVTGAAPLGETGLLGNTGFSATGLAGITGVVGIQGLYGETGIQGSTGILGVTGLSGFTGIDGEEGFRFLGSTGIQGVTGSTTSNLGVSISGETGLQGTTGILGATGVRGITGVAPNNVGITGEQGLSGSTGTLGITGLIVAGPQGPFFTLSAQNPVTNTATYTIDAAALTADEQYLQIISWGTLNTATANTIQLTIGSTALVDTSVYVDPQPTGYNTYYINITIIRVSSTTQECISELTVSNTTRYTLRTPATLNLAISNLLTLTLPTGAVIRGLIVRKALQA